MKPKQNVYYEDSSLHRLVSWLDTQKSWGGKLRGGHLVQEIEKILDLYLANGPSHQLQNAFNSLAARKPELGWVRLRLRVGPTDEQTGLKAVRSAILRKTPKESEQLIKSGSDQEKLGKFLSQLPSKTANRILNAYRSRLLGVVHNPLFDLWLTLLNPDTARRIRRCRTSDCQKFFVAWPGKKEYCSKFCRNRFWNRPRRAARGHRKPPSARF